MVGRAVPEIRREQRKLPAAGAGERSWPGPRRGRLPPVAGFADWRTHGKAQWLRLFVTRVSPLRYNRIYRLN